MSGRIRKRRRRRRRRRKTSRRPPPTTTRTRHRQTDRQTERGKNRVTDIIIYTYIQKERNERKRREKNKEIPETSDFLPYTHKGPELQF